MYSLFVVSEPDKPTNLQVAVTVNSLTVTWDAPSTGLVDKYKIELGGVSNSQEIDATNTRTAEFTSLIAGKQYSVVVVAISGTVGAGGQQSDGAEGSYYTSESREHLHEHKTIIWC